MIGAIKTGQPWLYKITFVNRLPLSAAKFYPAENGSPNPGQKLEKKIRNKSVLWDTDNDRILSAYSPVIATKEIAKSGGMSGYCAIVQGIKINRLTQHLYSNLIIVNLIFMSLKFGLYYKFKECC